MIKDIGFIGLGVMGVPYGIPFDKKKGIHIIRRNSNKTKNFIKKYTNSGLLKKYDCLKELASNTKLMISCVGNDKDLEDIYLSKSGIIKGINPNTIVVDHTTASPEISKKLYKMFLQKKSFFLMLQ